MPKGTPPTIVIRNIVDVNVSPFVKLYVLDKHLLVAETINNVLIKISYLWIVQPNRFTASMIGKSFNKSKQTCVFKSEQSLRNFLISKATWEIISKYFSFLGRKTVWSLSKSFTRQNIFWNIRFFERYFVMLRPILVYIIRSKEVLPIFWRRQYNH